MSNIKNVLLRFPHLGQQIFQILDNQDLNKCLKVSRYCKTFIEDQKFFWIRRIVQMTNIDIIDIGRGVKSFRNLCGQDVTRRWAARRRFLICRNHFLENLLKKSNRKDIQEMHTVSKSKQQKSQHSNVFYFALLCGQTEILKKLFNSSTFEDHIKRAMKQTILYHAAERGQMEIVQFIIESQNPANPRGIYYSLNHGFCDCSNGNTPLHIAAENGQLSICQLIITYLTDKNPRGYRYNGRPDRRSPLDLAALNGHLDVFKLFFENNDDEKNPKNEFCLGETPLHLAAEKGHFNICNFIIQKLENKKNPRDYSNGTPLHRAAKNGFYSICELIIQNVRIKFPKDDNGFTPRDLAQENGHQEICQLFEKNPKKRKIG